MSVKYVLLGCCLAALVLGFIYMFVLKCCAAILTWTVIILYHLIWAAGAYFFYDKSKNPVTDSDVKNVDMNLYIGYFCAGIFALTLLITLCLYSRIKLAIAIIKTAS